MKKYLPCLLSTSFFMFSSVVLANPKIYVTVFEDSIDGVCDAHCSLREAIALANERQGRDIIQLKKGTYSLSVFDDYPSRGNETGGESIAINDLDITDDVDIVGAGMYNTIIDPDGVTRIFDIHKSKVRLKKLTLQNGFVSGAGGAIRNTGILLISQCSIQDNRSLGGDSLSRTAGAIFNQGYLSIYASTLIHNNSLNGPKESRAGAIYNVGHLFIRDSGLTNNSASSEEWLSSGGAIYNEGDAEIHRSTLSLNSVSGYGGDRMGSAITNIGAARLVLTNSTVVKNYNGGDTDNNDAAIANLRVHDAIPEVTLKQVTVANNGVYGLWSTGNAYLHNSVMVANRHYPSMFSANCVHYGEVFEQSGVMLGEGGNENCSMDYAVDDSQGVDAFFNVAVNVPVFSLLYYPKPESALIDSGTYPCLATDQLGRPTNYDGDDDGYGDCDIGAIEWQP